MKKLFALSIVVVLSLGLFLSIFSAEKKVLRLTGWSYENGNTWRVATGDTVTGVAAAAASLDTVYIGFLGRGSVMPDEVTVLVSTTDVNNQDTLTVTAHSLAYNFSAFGTTLQTDNLVGAGKDFVLKYTPTAGNDVGLGYALIFDGTKGADTDSTAYTIKAYGVYSLDSN